MNTYELPIGLYWVRDEKVPLKDFNISVTVSEFKGDAGNVFAKHERLSGYIGHTFEVLSKNPHGFKISNKNKEEDLDPTLFNLKFSKLGVDNFNIDTFVKQVKVADVTKEFQQLAQTLVFGYLEHHVNHEKPYMDGLREWIKKDPDSFILLLENKKDGTTYFFPGGYCSDINEFKEVMSQSLKGFPNHLKVLDDYCNDWSQALEKSNKPKRLRI